MTPTTKAIIRIVPTILFIIFWVWGKQIAGFLKIYPFIGAIGFVVFGAFVLWVINKNKQAKP